MLRRVVVSSSRSLTSRCFALAGCCGELLLGSLHPERGGPFGDPIGAVLIFHGGSPSCLSYLCRQHSLKEKKSQVYANKMKYHLARKDRYSRPSTATKL